jgi:hypothetical protein
VRPALRLIAVRLLCLVTLAALAVYTCLPLWPAEILSTLANDLANHVRHVHEYRLALRERQRPPIVAPTLDRNIRVPVFQYYTGTGYLVPGRACRHFGLDPYESLKLSIMLHAFAAGGFAYLSCRALGAGRAASLLAGAALQVFPFGGIDLFNRGAYAEVIAMQTAPAVLFFSLRLARATTRSAALTFGGLAAAAWAYFIPLHPIQTLLCGSLVGALAGAYALLDRRSLGSAARVAAAYAAGVAASAWFWYPIVRDRPLLRISPHAAFYDTGLADLSMLLAPAFRRVTSHPGWAPQLGLHFALAAVAALLLWRRVRAAGVVAALAVAGAIYLLVWGVHVPAVQRALAPLQWTYRLLLPAALAGALCLGLVAHALGGWFRDRRDAGLVTGLLFAYAVAISPPYYLGQAKLFGYGDGQPHLATVAQVTSPAFEAPSTTNSYALRGADYARLELVADGGRLNANQDLRIPAESNPVDVVLTLDRPPGAAGDADVKILVNGKPRDAAKTADGNVIRLAFSYTPSLGLYGNDETLRFETTPPDAQWMVRDLTFHDQGDPAGVVCRVPEQITQTRRGLRPVWGVTVPPGEAGLYQVPLCYVPSYIVKANGQTVAPPSANKFLVMVPLKEGWNVVRVRTQPTMFAWRLAVVAMLVMAGCVVAGLVSGMREHARNRPARTGSLTSADGGKSEAAGSGQMPGVSEGIGS